MHTYIDAYADRYMHAYIRLYVYVYNVILFDKVIIIGALDPGALGPRPPVGRGGPGPQERPPK